MLKLKQLMAALAVMLAAPQNTWEQAKIVAAADEAIRELAAVGGDNADTRQLRKDLDDLAGQLRKVQRAGVSAPVIVNAGGQAFDRPVMRFSHPELSRGFAEFAQHVKTAQTGGQVNKDLQATGDGTYVIPNTYLAELARFVENVGVAARLARSIPLGAGTLNRPRRLAGCDVHWQTAGAEVAETTPTFGTMTMSAKTLMGLCDVDVQFDEDSMIGIGDFLATEFAYALAAEEDRCAFRGTGLATDGLITGLMTSTFVTQVDPADDHDLFVEVTYTDLTAVEAAVWEGALANASWLWHRTIKAILKNLTDTAGHPVWQPPSSGEPATYMGYPQVSASQMPTSATTAASAPMLAFGDFRNGLYLGRRGQMSIGFSEHAGWRNLQRVWRAHERLDIAVCGYTAAEIVANPELANPIARLNVHS